MRVDIELVQFADDTSILCRYEPGEKKIAKKYWKHFFADREVHERKFTSNADKTEILYFLASDEVEPKVTIKANLIESAGSCYLEIHLEPKLSVEIHLNLV